MGQALWRKTHYCLVQNYKDSGNEIGKWLKHSFGLHFVCPSDEYLCNSSLIRNSIQECGLKSHQTTKERIVWQKLSLCILMHSSTPPSHPTFFVLFVQGTTYILILDVVVLLYGERNGSLPEKFAHLNDLPIRSFDFDLPLISFSVT